MDELLTALRQAILTQNEDGALEATRGLLHAGVEPRVILESGLAEAMLEVGRRWKCGEAFLPEVIVAAKIFSLCNEIVEPVLLTSGETVRRSRPLVLATVKGDLHDLGKNLVGAMAKTVGFDVRDLGKDVSVDEIVAAAGESSPCIVGRGGSDRAGGPPSRREGHRRWRAGHPTVGRPDWSRRLRAGRGERGRTGPVVVDLIRVRAVKQGPEPASLALVACGALIAEVRCLVEAHGWRADLYGIPATYHMRPSKIVSAVDEQLERIRDRYDRVIVVYGDCGTAGMLDDVLRRHEADRPEGSHCYEIFCGGGFCRLLERDPTSYFLTDYLVRAWEDVVLREMGLDREPSLKETVFGGFTSLTYLRQSSDPGLLARAEGIAEDLGLPLNVEDVGLGEIEMQLARLIEESARH
jgi:hypothetical protein